MLQAPRDSELITMKTKMNETLTRPSLIWLAKFVGQYCRYALTQRARAFEQHAVAYLLSGAAGASWMQSSWRGRKLLKSPTDLLMYSEIIDETRPGCIVEVGTFDGGSALWFRDTGRALGVATEIVTVDLVQTRPDEDGIRYVCGKSGDVIGDVARIVAGRTVMVTLDGDHTASGVLCDLDAYSRLVQPGGYMVVEDTIIGALTDDSPARAVREWLPTHPEFRSDKSRERLGLSFAPGGWLRRSNAASDRPPTRP